MTVKIYNVIGVGLVVGEKIRQDNEKIYLKYPGVIVPNQQTKDGMRNLMVPPIPTFFDGQLEMLREFPLKKIHVSISGKPSSETLELYLDYSKKVRQAVTGIKVMGSDAMSRLPRTGKGEPIIK